MSSASKNLKLWNNGSVILSICQIENTCQVPFHLEKGSTVSIFTRERYSGMRKNYGPSLQKVSFDKIIIWWFDIQTSPEA